MNVGAYQYDGLRRRTVKKVYSGGVLSETRDIFYSAGWQDLEERVGGSSNAQRQFVWGLRYIDDLVLRDRDTTGSGVLDERLYAFQDPNWNVTGVVNSVGSVQERYGYDAYGMSTVLSALFVPQGSSSIDWETRHGGYRWDSESGFDVTPYRNGHPLLGCWISRDPLGLAAEVTLNGYVGNNPVTFADPDGLEPAIPTKKWLGKLGLPIWAQQPTANIVESVLPGIKTVNGVRAEYEAAVDIGTNAYQWKWGEVGKGGLAYVTSEFDKAGIGGFGMSTANDFIAERIAGQSADRIRHRLNPEMAERGELAGQLLAMKLSVVSALVPEIVVAQQVRGPTPTLWHVTRRQGGFSGDVVDVWSRAWATDVPPNYYARARFGATGDWMKDPGLLNTLRRLWFTGRRAPATEWRQVSPSVATQFTRPGYGPNQLWKGLGGQWAATKGPGNMNLQTGQVSCPTLIQLQRYQRGQMGNDYGYIFFLMFRIYLGLYEEPS